MSSEIRIYVSTTPGSLERKKMMERTVNVINGLASRLNYTVATIDIADLENKEAKEFMLSNGRSDSKGHVAAPQIFNGETLCGNYEEFDFALEDDQLKEFLKLN
jgi:glutaredoxin